MDYFKNYISEQISNSQFKNIPEYYQHRFIYAKDSLENISSNRNIDTPSYLNDLGVRKSNDPRISYLYYLEKGAINPVKLENFEEDIKNELSILAHFDAFILITGDFEGLYKITKKYIKKIEPNASYNLLIALGSLYAGVRDNYCINIFDHASQIANSQEDKVIAIHRKLAYIIKRLNDSSINIDQEFNIFSNELMKIDNKHNQQIYRALYNNLIALYYVHKKVDSNFIENTLIDAKLFIDGLLYKERSEADPSLLEQSKRYRGQINNNLAQIMIIKNRFGKANEILDENYEFMIQNAPDYSAESAYMLANSFYHLEDYQNTIRYSIIAREDFEKIGAITGRRNTDQLLISALYKNQELDEANNLYSQFKKESEWINENITG